MFSTFHIVGAGWAGKLAAYWLLRHFPQAEIHLWDQRPGFDSSHTWSFFESDIPEELLPILQDIPHTRWPKHCVHFPQFSREISIPYWSVEEDRLNQFLSAQVALQWHWGKSIKNLDDFGTQPTQVIIWATGWPPLDQKAHPLYGWQKFVGLKFRLQVTHRLTAPIIMDARIPQRDGYRFFYVLPYSDRDLLIEDTYYSRDISIDIAKIKEEIFQYTKTQFGAIEDVLHEEVGCLPIPLWPPHVSTTALTPLPRSKSLEGESLHQTYPRMFTLGASAGAFHPVTGYSSEALFKQLLALNSQLRIFSKSLPWNPHSPSPGHWLKIIDPAKGTPSQTKSSSLLWYLLNQFLFLGAPDLERWKVFDFFYRHQSPKLISRFYNRQMRWQDWISFFMHWPPPITVGRALGLIGRFLWGTIGWSRSKDKKSFES
ncbi:MAG: lycopene cyclase family protein [Bdellovibrionaceae bacterium]|jgi:lycopene beta-cyclase|nr:lycopene cyclase family protein [Pseudobdellovibrionaceae bacterium]